MTSVVTTESKDGELIRQALLTYVPILYLWRANRYSYLSIPRRGRLGTRPGQDAHDPTRRRFWTQFLFIGVTSDGFSCALLPMDWPFAHVRHPHGLRASSRFSPKHAAVTSDSPCWI